MELFMLDGNELSEEEIRIIRNRFPDRTKRSARFVLREDALSVIAAGVLLHRVLGVDDERVILKTAEGRPFIDGGRAFSLSHSGGRCVLVVGSSRVGVDIERIDESNLIAAGAALTEDELEWIKPMPNERFHVLWTRKESIFKAVGGFADPKQIPAMDGAEPEGLYVKSTLLDGFALSVCCDEAIGEIAPVHIK